MADSNAPSSDRRRHRRSLACAAVRMEAAGNAQTLALISNISASGALLLTRSAFEVGEQVDLSIHLQSTSEGPTIEVQAEVVRHERLGIERADFWTEEIAVRFSGPLDEYGSEIEQLAAAVQKAGLPG